MLRSSLLSLALLVATGLAAQDPAPQARTGDLTVHFPLASAELGAGDEAALRALCDRVDIAQVKRISLNGHTDVRGSVPYNDALSERRAARVMEVLNTTCLKGLAVRVHWSGELEPLLVGTSETAHAGNRRVEVVLEYSDADAAPVKANAHPKVKPLMPAIDKPREIHRVSANEGIDVTMSDGVRVRIPAGAILDAQGNVVDRDVELSYRSFNEPYEIIASGIPMHVNGEYGVQHMETAGMYELYASLEGAPLTLAPGAKITLERPEALAIAQDFTGWRLDPTTGSWVAGGTIMTTSAPSTISASLATEATSVYWLKLWDLEREKRPDTTLFADRREGGNYCHLTACDTAAPGTTWLKKRNRFKHIARVPEIHVVGYKGIYDPEHILFKVEFRGRDDEQFPEWRRVPYTTVWEYTGPEPRAVFKRLYGRRHYFQDINLVMEPEATEGTIALKENGQWIELPVKAQWDRSKPLPEARWRNAMELYDKALVKRSMRFDRDVQRSARRYNREHANMPMTAWKKARSAMDGVEKPMELDPWREYASTRRPVNWMLSNANAQRDLSTVQTTFGLQDFGVYNIDRIMKMAEQQNVIAAAVDPDGKPFPWVNGFAVLKDENSVITYWGRSNGTGDNFLVSPGNMRSLFLVDADGKIARADVAPLNSREPRVILKVTPLEDPKSIDELRAQAAP